MTETVRSFTLQLRTRGRCSPARLTQPLCTTSPDDSKPFCRLEEFDAVIVQCRRCYSVNLRLPIEICAAALSEQDMEVAVRSSASATAEDLPNASFAGAHESS